MGPAAGLDPIGSVADLAMLMARLADPFANRAQVLASAHTTEEAVLAGQSKWTAELRASEKLARLYRELFTRERSRLRGESSPVVADAPALAPQPVPIPPPARPLPLVDETAMAPMLTLGGPALPFVEGRFEPPVQAVEARKDRENDPNATQLQAQVELETLPFVRMLPSQALKKRT